MAKVLLAIPTGGGIHENVAVLAAHFSANKNVVFMAARGRPVDYTRNGLIQQFLQMPEFTHILFLDSDTEPPLDCVEKLLALNVPLASGCYPVLMPNGLRWALANKDNDGHYRLLERIENDPFEVDAGGAGCLLIRRDVFEVIKWPWFQWINYEDGSQEGEDINFFKKCNQASLRLMAEPTVICNHYKEINLTNIMRIKMKGN
jgi:hypothetical protein